MRQQEIKHILNHIESHYRVNEWVLEEVEIWPLIRVRLWYALSYKSLELSNDDSIQHQSKLNQLIRVLKSPFLWLFNSLKDYRASFFRIPKGDILVLGDGVSFTKIQEKYFDKFADSMANILDDHALKTVRLDTTDQYLTPRARPSYFVQAMLDSINLRSLLEAKLKKSDFELQDFDDVYNYVRQFSEEQLFDKSLIHLRVVKINKLEAFFKKVLAKGKFKAAMSVCYYSDFGFALNLACKRLGIPSYDLQHGVQGVNHGAYGAWLNVPQQGYNVLPNYFLVWSQKEKDTISAWSKNTTNHESLITGNLLANVWSRLLRNSTEKKNELISNLNSSNPNILLTLSWDVSGEDQIGNVLTVIKSTQEQYNWMIRLHPSMMSEKETIESMLKSNGILKYELNKSTELPLFTVLELSDYHITHSSTCVIEASYFNVPSMIVSEYGWSLLSNQLESKWISKTLTSQEIQQGLMSHFSAQEVEKVIKSTLENGPRYWVNELMETFNGSNVSS